MQEKTVCAKIIQKPKKEKEKYQWARKVSFKFNTLKLSENKEKLEPKPEKKCLGYKEGEKEQVNKWVGNGTCIKSLNDVT